MTDYVVQDGSIQIPNQATVKIGDESQNSNTVITKPPVIDASATKSILEDGELKQHQDLEKGEAIQYQMDFEVPNNKKLTSLVLYDDMEDVLDISTADAKVYLGNQDVTAKGTLKFDEEAEKIVWTATNPQEFSGKKLTLRASASVKEDADLSTYVDENGMVVIPNEAHMTVNDEDVPSNVVTVTPPPVEPSVNKHILADDEEVTHQDVTLTDLITYKLDYQVPTNEKITELILWDDMEDVLEIQTKDVSITCDGVDVTAEGELTINEETEKLEWKATNPAKFTGKKLTVQVSAKVKAGADLSSYMDGNGEIMIPNTAHMKVNDEELESPVVTVTPPTPADPLNPLTPLAPDVDKPLVPTNPTEESNPKTKTEQEAVNEIPKTGSAGTGYKLLDFFKGLF
ncbi:isopeptide-forming domain-containing fimbrial protein [Listeria floridensis]|uniref:isopeptide-forming domain-containing fimbrial protein n=1 Tax=Listeria floridensis TaxID=1494962 RepID=UPI0004BC0DF1|nr:isopeptide-forming domain-containing fimbrial protein [Listeria floridensis]